MAQPCSGPVPACLTLFSGVPLPAGVHKTRRLPAGHQDECGKETKATGQGRDSNLALIICPVIVLSRLVNPDRGPGVIRTPWWILPLVRGH